MFQGAIKFILFMSLVLATSGFSSEAQAWPCTIEVLRNGEPIKFVVGGPSTLEVWVEVEENGVRTAVVPTQLVNEKSGRHKDKTLVMQYLSSEASFGKPWNIDMKLIVVSPQVIHFRIRAKNGLGDSPLLVNDSCKTWAAKNYHELN